MLGFAGFIRPAPLALDIWNNLLPDEEVYFGVRSNGQAGFFTVEFVAFADSSDAQIKLGR